MTRGDTRLAALIVLAVATGALSAGCGSSQPKETFKHAQAEVAKPYVSLLKVAESQASTGTDMTAAEERATAQVIAAVNLHRPALGLREAKRSLTVTAYTLNKLGDMCPDCQAKLNAAAQAMK